MTGWLLDTNVLSELRRPKPERKVLAFIAAQPLDLLYVSTVTLAEIRFRIELVADAGRRAELNDWLAHKARPMFEQCVVPVSEDIMLEWRLLVEDGRKAGHTLSQPDLTIAATALRHGLRRRPIICEPIPYPSLQAKRSKPGAAVRPSGSWRRACCGHWIASPQGLLAMTDGAPPTQFGSYWASPYRRHSRRERLSEGARLRAQPLARRGADKRRVMPWVRRSAERKPF